MSTVTKHNHFDTSHLHAELKKHTVRGGIATLGAQGCNFVLNVGSTAVLARLLTPSDFGLVAMVTALTGLLAMFKDAGLSMATVQKDTVTHEQVSTLFWVNIALSLLLMLLIAALSPFVAGFYNEPRLQPITLAIAGMFLFDGLAVQHQALLRRQMRFGALAKIQLISMALALAAAIGAAVIGMGYWALILQLAVNQLASAALTWLYCRWTPGLPRRGAGTRSMLKFGGYLTGFNFVNYFARNADNILIGKLINADALGIYSRAYSIVMLPITLMSGPISGVAVPTLCRLHGDRERLHKYYLHILYMLSLIAGPIAGVAFLASKEMIVILLGDKWSAAADVFKYLAIGAVLQPLYNTQSWLHMAAGKANRVFIWGLIGTPIILASFFIGLIWGINGVAFCYSMAIIITTVGSLSYAGQSAGLFFGKMLNAVFRPILSCIIAVAGISVLSVFVAPPYLLLSILIKVTGFISVYSISLLVMYKGAKPYRDLLEIGQIMTRGKAEEHTCVN